MKIYHYDELGILTGDSEADANPLEAGKFLIPANATDIPPVGDENVFKSGAWSKQPDNRGKQVWSQTTGELSVVDYIGAIKLGFTETPPPANTIFKNGKWVADMDGMAAAARGKRNALLAGSDYMMLTDAPEIAGAKEYRQALRDLPKSKGWPVNIVWPVLVP